MLLEGIREAHETLLAAELRIDAAVVDDVVAVDGSRSGGVDRGCVEMADAEPCEVGDDADGVIEREVLVELQPVGRSRRRGRERARSRLRAAPFLGEGG